MEPQTAPEDSSRNRTIRFPGSIGTAADGRSPCGSGEPSQARQRSLKTPPHGKPSGRPMVAPAWNERRAPHARRRAKFNQPPTGTHKMGGTAGRPVPSRRYPRRPARSPAQATTRQAAKSPPRRRAGAGNGFLICFTLHRTPAYRSVPRADAGKPLTTG